MVKVTIFFGGEGLHDFGAYIYYSRGPYTTYRALYIWPRQAGQLSRIDRTRMSFTGLDNLCDKYLSRVKIRSVPARSSNTPEFVIRKVNICT